MPLTRARSWQQLMATALLSGSIAGLAAFAVQLVAIGPLIAQAETMELRGDSHAEHGNADEWEPREGFERTAYTAVGSVLAGIGFAAILAGVASLLGLQLNIRRGVMLGLAGFVCFAVAPAIGLPPKPPGVPGADVGPAQLWWVMTAVSTAAGLTLVFMTNTTRLRLLGVAVALVPHLIGPPAAAASTLVPASFSTRFALTSVATQAVLWLVLGAVLGRVARAGLDGNHIR